MKEEGSKGFSLVEKVSNSWGRVVDCGEGRRRRSHHKKNRGKAGVALSKRGLGRSASFALVIQSSTAAEASIALETGEPA